MSDINTNPMVLPDNLPRPVDDGGADHLVGMRIPNLSLASTAGGLVNLGALPRRTIVYAYPMTGVPNVELPQGWNEIPGARGCTPQTLSFQDQKDVISALGADVYGLSTQTSDYQKEMADRLGLSFAILSDANFKLTEALRLPTMTVEGMVLLKRLTLVIKDGVIEHVFYPVFPPNQAAAEVVAWLAAHPAAGTAQADQLSGVTIYTTADCPYCKAARTLLRERGIAFTEIDVDRDPAMANAMAARSGGRRTVPQIFAGQVHIGGADDLQALDRSGRLQDVLAKRQHKTTTQDDNARRGRTRPPPPIANERTSMTVTVYGIRNCDTMKKARAWLDAHGVAYRFHDYKQDGIDKARLVRWCGEAGWEVLLNRAGTTFRKLPDADKADLDERRAIALMLAQPSLIKRPVIETARRIVVGFKPEVYARAFASRG